jgi:hypothetical protein
VTIQASFTLTPYTINLTNDGHGTTTPNGTLTLNHGIASGSISTTPSAGYQFKNWSVTVGSGIAFSPNATTTPATITATGGNATVQANFELIPYTLTINAGTGGYVSPSGARTVSYGVAFQLHAYPYGTYKFVNWTKASGAGTVTFSPAATDPAATATVTGGNVVITANFAKESLALTEVGSSAFSNTTTYPEAAKDIYFFNNYLYVIGNRTTPGTDSVLRRYNVSNPVSPSSITGEDYVYISGVAQAVIGNGTYLYTGTTSTNGTIRGLLISNFGPGATLYSASTASPALDLAITPGSTTYLWALTGGIACEGTVTPSGANLYIGGYYVINPDAGSFTYLEKTPYALLAVQEDNGAHQLSAYNVDATAGATWDAPDSTVAIHNGGDMDPGQVGRIALHPDGEWVAIPVNDPYEGYLIRTFGTDDPNDVYFRGQVTLTGYPKQISVGDYYIYVAAYQGTTAYIYVIDAYNPSAPVVKTSYAVTGFEWVDAVYVNGDYLYAIVDSSSASKPTLKVIQITRS